MERASTLGSQAVEQFLEAMPDGVVGVGSDGRIVFANRQAEVLTGYPRHELVEMLVDELVPDGLRAAHAHHRESFGRRPSVRGMGTQLDIRLRRKDGDDLPVDIALSPIETGAGRVVVASMRDITERRRQEQVMRALLDVAETILEGRDEETLLRLVASRARSLAQAGVAWVVTAGPRQGDLVVRATDGDVAGLTVGEADIGRVVQSGEPVLVEETERDGGPALIVPLHAGRGRGAIALVGRPGGRGFDDSDVRRVQLFAAQAAVAIDHARLRGELQRLAVLEDRERIGRELHDGAIQALFAVGMDLQAMSIMTEDATLQGRLERGVAQIDEVIRDLRGYIFGLRPGLAADRGLARALRELAEQLEERHGVTCAVDIDPEVAAAVADRSADLVQVTREALANVGRHARASTCRVSLRREDEAALLEIDDDGRGFVVGEASGAGWGLRNLEERARAMGGRLEIAAMPGEGTTVSLTLPV